MPQLDLLNTESPHRLTVVYQEDPLNPNKPCVATITVHDVRGFVMAQQSRALPKQWAPQVWADAAKAAIEAYEAETGKAAVRAWLHCVRDWEDSLEAIAQTR